MQIVTHRNPDQRNAGQCDAIPYDTMKYKALECYTLMTH